MVSKKKTKKLKASAGHKPMRLHIREFDVGGLTLMFLADLHHGSKYSDTDMFKENLDWCLERNNVYVIDGGDLMETATKDSVGAGVFEQDEIVQEQLESVEKMYRPLAQEGRLLGLHRGNHEYRLFKHSGINPTKTLAKMLGVKYFGDGVFHYFKVGNQNYTLYTCHGTSAAKLPHTKIKACIDLASMVDAEIYIMGHTHQLSQHTRIFYQIDKRSKVVKESQKHFVLGGSYLTHWGSYAHMKGYEMMRKGSPKIKLHGKEHIIRVSL
jgi:UDP-2,3-diacylglucosamine pyrophosphatase LpxH